MTSVIHFWVKYSTAMYYHHHHIYQNPQTGQCSVSVQHSHHSTRKIGTSAQRVGFFNIGSGRVLEKIPGSGSGSGRVGVLKIRSGIFGYLFYSRVIPGIFG